MIWPSFGSSALRVSFRGMEIKELGHIVLYVHDIERSAAFYGDILGWKQLKPSESTDARTYAGRAVQQRPHAS